VTAPDEGDLAADLKAIDESFGALHDVKSPERGQGDREQHHASMWRHTE
jgi:hypothetical protein